MTQPELELAIKYAIDAHHGQLDKAGAAYIFHPLRVMDKVYRRTNDYFMAVVAVLHDVVEDTGVTLFDIGNQFGPDVECLLDYLTRRKADQTYLEYIEKIKENGYAVAIKLADIEDNLLPWREFEGRDSLVRKYEKAKEILLGAQ